MLMWDWHVQCPMSRYELNWEAAARTLTCTLDLWLIPMSVEMSIFSGYISPTHAACHNTESRHNTYMQYMMKGLEIFLENREKLAATQD